MGFVLGVTIFVFPGELAPMAGPALFISFLIAGIPTILSCFVAAQLGNIFPTSGRGYVAASTVLSPFWGFMVVWNIMICMVTGIPAVAYGFAKYAMYFGPFQDWNIVIVAGTCVVFFGLINLIGVQATAWMQAVMITIYIAVLAVFVIGGMFHMNLDLMRPLIPGPEITWGSVLQAAVIATYTMSGYMVISEMGDDIRDPRRTIPRALLISFVLVSFLYVGACFVAPGLLPWRELAASQTPVADAAVTFLPPIFGPLIALSALLGGATTVNAWFLTQSRDVFALARDRVFPAPLARVNAGNKEPAGALIFCTFIVLVGVLTGGRISDYGMLTVFGMFFVSVIVGVVVFLAPRRVPRYYARAEFKLGRIGLPFFSIAFILSSVVFIAFGILGSPMLFLTYVSLLVPGMVYYALRKRYLRGKGVDIEVLLTRDLSHLIQP